MTENNANIGFEKQIWDAACVLWGHIPAAEYRKVIVGLIFLRYISSAFKKRYEELVAEGDGFEDDFVVALDAGDFESVGLGSVGQLLVVLAEGVAEAVDIDLRGARDERLTGDEKAVHEVNAGGLYLLRQQVGEMDLYGVALVIIAQGAELGEVATVGDRQGGNL